MANDTRSRQRNKDGEGDSSGKRIDSGKGTSNSGPIIGDSSRLRRPTRDASSSGQMTSSLSSTRKSERLETRHASSSGQKTLSLSSTRKSERLGKRTPSTSPSVTRKSEGLEKQSTPSPLRRSDRGRAHSSSTSSRSKSLEKVSSSVDRLNKREKKEKIIKQLTMEPVNVISGEKRDQESLSLKRKKMDGRSYKALFKKRKRRYSASGCDDKLERQDMLPQVDSVGSDASGSKQLKDENGGNECGQRVTEDLREEPLEGASWGAVSGLKASDAKIFGNDMEPEISYSSQCLSDKPAGPSYGHDLMVSIIGCTIKETIHDVNKGPRIQSPMWNLQIPKLGPSTCMARSLGSNTELGSGALCMQSEGKRSAIIVKPDVTGSLTSKCISGLVAEAAPLASMENESYCFVRNCAVCSKRRRLDYDSPEVELCSCRATLNWTSGDISRHKVSGNLEAAFISESIGRYNCITQPKETLPFTEMDSLENACVMCKKRGKLLCCDGESCRTCYHRSCLDPSLDDDPPGVWHCSNCVKKKIDFGVHTVSKAVESIWDVREVVVSDMKGIHRQKQYLVKYQGLAHVYNHWVPETQLLHESPSLVAKFNTEHQIVTWNSEWRLPHRLLRKRRLMSCSLQDDYQSSNNDVPNCQFEWLVKWRGLDYEHATWEVDSMKFLCSPQGQKLVKEYEIRHQKAKKMSDKILKSSRGALIELQQLPAGGSPIADDNLLNNVKKLLEFWYKNRSAVIFDEQDRLLSVILFIKTLCEYHQPFLIVTTPDALSQWEAEFMRLAPSVDVVVYSGNRDIRRSIRTLEFYDEGGGIMLQVLLSTLEVVSQDLQTFKEIKWEAIIVDECQCSSMNANVELIKVLQMNMKLLLFSGQLKDVVAEYQCLLSLLDSSGDMNEVGGLKSNPNDNLVQLKESLSQYIAYGIKSESSKFVEYWVPVPISNLQLEQYCSTLLTNTIALCSSSKKDGMGALLDILKTLRKCCNHPYTVDPFLQTSIIKGLQAPEVLDVGIKASGKVHLLDMILSKIRRLKLRVLIIFQSNAGSGGIPIGNILEDFLCQRFGPDSYERFDANLEKVKRQAVLDRFNNKEGGEFVFLLDNRPRIPSIKLSVDIVVIFDAEWNPANDIKALQRISFNSQSEQIKVFRLYSSYTLEEKVLILAKDHNNVESNLQNTSRATSDTLLMWGASYLFRRLDKYHAEKSTVSAADVSSGQQWLLDDVVKDFMAKLVDVSKNNSEHDSIISKVLHSEGVYHTDCLLLGEREVKLTDGEERQIFWKKLVEGRHPRWKFLSGPTPRSRKRVYYSENDEATKKHQKDFDSGNTPPSFQLELEERVQAARSKAEASVSAAANQSESLSVACTLGKAINTNLPSQQSCFLHESDMAHPEERTPNEQKSLHILLRAEMAKLCEILKLSNDMIRMVQSFLEYVMENCHVNKEPASILQAFQMSLCRIAASILKEKVDWRDYLKLAKQTLNFQCTEEEAISVYVKLRALKRTFVQLPGNKSDSIPSKNVVSASEGITELPSKAGEPPSESFNLKNVKVEVEEWLSNLESSQEQAIDELTANNMVRKKFKKFQKNCDKHVLKLRQKQEEEFQEFHKMLEQKRVQLEGQHQLELAFIRTMYNQTALGMDKLKIADSEFQKKIQEHEFMMEMQLKELEARHAAAIEEESKRVADLLAKMNSCMSPCRNVDQLHMHGSEYCEMGSSEGSGHITSKSPENEFPCSGPYLGEPSPERIVHVSRASDVIVSRVSVTAADDGVGYSTHSKTLRIAVNPVSAEALEIVPAEASCVARVEQSKESSRTSNITPEINAQDLVGCSVPAETSTFVLNSTSQKALESAPVETSSVARFEQPKKVNYLSHKTLEINPNCSSHGVEETVAVTLATSKEQNTHKISSSGQNNDIPSGVSSTPGSPQQCVIHDEYPPNMESTDMHAEDLPVTGDRTAAVGFLSSTPFDTGFTMKSNCEAQVTANSEQLQLTSDCSSLGCSQPAAEAVHQGYIEGRTSMQTFEACTGEKLARPASDYSSPTCSQPTTAEAVQQGHIEGSNSQQTSEASPQLVEASVELSPQAISQAGKNLVQLASQCSSPVCSQPIVAEDVHQSNIDGSNSVQTSEGWTGENLVQPASNFSSPVCSQPTIVEAVDQRHIDGSNSLQTSGASLRLVDGLVELTPEAVSMNGENLVQLASNCSSTVYSQPTATESVHQGHSERVNSLRISEASSQEVEGSVELSQRAVSQNGENLVLPPFTEGRDSGLNIRSISGTNHERNAEPTAVHQNIMPPTQVIENAAELRNQALLQSRPNVIIPEGSTNLPIHQPHHVASWNPTPPLHAEPLQNELERIHKEVEQTIKLHESTKLRFKSECEKEIEEMIAQIRSKYEAKLRDAEIAFLLKKTELDSNHKKVLMNKILAEAFRSKCLDLRPSGISSMQQGASVSFIQRMNQFSLQSTVRHPSAATLSSAGLPAVSQQTAIPPVQSLHRSSGLFSSFPARPPQISAITPSVGGLRVSGELRAPAPHLQPFRPPACTSAAASTSCLPCNIPSQQVPMNLPARSLSLSSVPAQPLSSPSQFALQQNSSPPPQPPAALQPIRISQAFSSDRPSQPLSGVQPGCHNPTLSAMELLMDIDNQAGGHLPNILQHLAGSGLNTSVLDPSVTRACGNVDHSLTPPAIGSDVVCLSDDDD